MGPVGLWDLDIGVRVLAFMAGMELKSWGWNGTIREW